MPTTVPVYAALLALLFIFLSLRVIRLRRSERVPLGHGESRALMRATRVQANFAEYVPLALLLLLLLELSRFPVYLVHGFGTALLLGRAAHAYGVSQESENFRFRVGGMYATFFAIVGPALLLIGAAILPG